MIFEDERWVKLYTRDTMGWRILTWQARTTLLHALRKVDRAGAVDLCEDGFDGLAVLLDLPPELVAEGVLGERGLIARGVAFLERNGETVTKCDASDTGRNAVFVLANFAAAQSARASGKQRAQKHREEKSVTPRYGAVTPRDETVTGSNTPSRSDQNRSEQTRTEEIPEREHAAPKPGQLVALGAGLGEAPLVKAEKAPKADRGLRLPEGWTPSEATVAAMKAEGHHSPLSALPGFFDYWVAQPGARGTKAGLRGWEATFRNWIRREIARAPGGGGPQRPAPGGRLIQVPLPEQADRFDFSEEANDRRRAERERRNAGM